MNNEMPKDIAAELRVRAAIEQIPGTLFDRAAAEIEQMRKDWKVFALSAQLCIDRLTAERDEARRELCAARRELCRNEAIIRLRRHRVHRDSEDVVGLAKEIAVERGWDCFKENTDD